MKNNLDYSFKEIVAALRVEAADEMVYIQDDRTIKERINDIEKKYFDGKHIYHNAGEKSDFLFRCEIKELLVALLKLEIKDPFKDGRTKKSGVSVDNINGLQKTYQLFETKNKLREYEKRILERSFDSEAATKYYSTLNRLSQSMSRFFLMTTLFYHNNASNFFDDITKQLDAWTANICMKEYEIAKYKNIFSVININMNNGQAELHDSFNSTFDLKQAIANAIKCISKVIYEFDENNVCKRRSMTDAISELEQLDMPVGNLKIKATEIDNIINSVQDGDDESRKLIEKFYNDLFDVLYQDPVKDAVSGLPPYSEGRLYNTLWEYCYRYYEFMKKESISLYERKLVLRLRTYLATQLMFSYPFKDTLYAIERDILDLNVIKKYKSVEDFRNDSQIQMIVDRHFVDFIMRAEDNLRLKTRSFSNMKAALKHWNRGNSIVDNYELLSSQCEEIVSNVFSMILKLESENNKANQNEEDDNGVSEFFKEIGFKKELKTQSYNNTMSEENTNEKDLFLAKMMQVVNASNQMTDDELAYMFADDWMLKMMGLRAVKSEKSDYSEKENEQ